MSQKETYSTSNLALSAALSLKVPLVTLDTTNKKAVFLFQETDELLKLIDEYWAGTYLVKPTRIF